MLRAGLVLAALSLVLTACTNDEGPAALSRARTRYEALVSEGRSPKDPAFNDVIAQLQTVKPNSKSHAEAQRLLQALERARGPSAPRPLARDSVPAEHENHP